MHVRRGGVFEFAVGGSLRLHISENFRVLHLLVTPTPLIVPVKKFSATTTQYNTLLYYWRFEHDKKDCQHIRHRL